MVKVIKFHKKLPTINELTQLLITEAMRRTNGNQTIAFKMLGIKGKAPGKYLNIKHLAKIAVIFIILFSCAVSNGNATDSYVEGQVVVTFFRGTPQEAIDGLIEAFNLTVREKIPQINYYVFNLPDDYTVPEIVSILTEQDIVYTCEPNYITETNSIPNDDLFSAQWGLDNTTNEGADLHITEAWGIESGNNDVIIAVIDMGFDITHEDLKENIWHNPGEKPENGIDDDDNGYIDDVIGWDFVDQPKGLKNSTCDWKDEDNDPTSTLSSHGNRVIGLISATTNNGIGIAGIAGDCKIMLIRAGFYNEGGNAVLSSSHIISGIIYATDNGASVINISSGSTRYSETYKIVLEYAIDNGVVIVCSAGNEGSDKKRYPAAYDLPGLISVGASTPMDNQCSFSSYGDWVDVSAPGQNIMSTLLDDEYGMTQGTSFAAPMVAGVAALIISKYLFLTPGQVQDRIMNTVDICEGLNGANISSGRVNAFRALYNPDENKSQTDVQSSGEKKNNKNEAVSTNASTGGGGCFIISADYGSQAGFFSTQKVIFSF